MSLPEQFHHFGLTLQLKWVKTSTRRSICQQHARWQECGFMSAVLCSLAWTSCWDSSETPQETLEEPAQSNPLTSLLKIQRMHTYSNPWVYMDHGLFQNNKEQWKIWYSIIYFSNILTVIRSCLNGSWYIVAIKVEVM